MIGLPWETWARMLVWLAIGMTIYTTYGFHRSHLTEGQG
jgi:APA family basic amino acid/polyamine antiporter